jgi:Protein of unknown function (DUF3619)
MTHTITQSTTQTTQFITQDQFAKALIARLDTAATDVSHDISERLRFARQRAVESQKLAQTQTVTQTAPAWQVQAGGSLAMGGGSGSGFGRFNGFNFDFFSKWSSLLPLLALVAGLFAINHFQSEMRAKDVAEIDSALLTDDLPPAAYADQGFGQFLKLQLPSEGRE